MYSLLYYYLGRKIASGYPWKCGHSVYIPTGALHSSACKGLMRGKLTDVEHA